MSRQNLLEKLWLFSRRGSRVEATSIGYDRTATTSEYKEIQSFEFFNHLVDADYLVFAGDQTGYRYYDASGADRARVIAVLRKLGFSITEIAEIVDQCTDESDLIELFERRTTKSRLDLRPRSRWLVRNAG